MKFSRLAKAFTVAAAAFAAAATYASDLHWLEKNQSLGRLSPDGEPKCGAVRFVNAGDTPIMILDALTSCVCTTVSYAPTPVLPGDTCSIGYRFNPKGMKPGPVNRSIRIVFDDGSRQLVRLTGEILVISN